MIKYHYFLNQRVKLLLLSLFLFVFCSDIFSQEKYFTRTGHIHFISHTEIIDIEADNYQVGSFINTKTGEIVFIVLMNAFEFKLDLAQEHFNENYVETHKYPKAKFKGKILNIEEIDFSSKKEYDVNVKGIIYIHGKSKEIETTGKIKLEEEKILASAKFQIELKDFEIKIPELVKDKVAPTIPINLDILYEPYR